MGEIVTGNYFTVLGVGAAMGRTILPDDDRSDAPRVAMISHRYWVGELGSAPNVVGRTLRHRGRRAGSIHRDGSGAVAGIMDSGIGVARSRAARDARHDAVADRGDAARSARRSVDVPARTAEAG